MKPGFKTIIAGVLVFLAGVIVLPLCVVLPLILGHSHNLQFKVPGSAEANIENPGRYYLWNDYQTVFNGRSYNRSEKIPDGMEIQIKDADGQPLQFFSDTSTSESGGGSSKNSIGYVQVEHPGKLEIQVSGGDGERIFSFSKSNLLKMFGIIMGGVGFSMLVGIIGIGLVIWGILKLVRASKTSS
ncbi:MAG TPA: hypothetical protein VIK53_10345 [Verrucomicrobiae bacterium]